MRRQLRALILIGLLVAAAVVVVAIPRFEIHAFGAVFERGNDNAILGLTLGLDLAGGTHLVYQGFKEDGGPASAEDMEGVRRIIEARVNQFGLSEPTVQLLGTERVLIEMPGLSGASISVTFEGDTVTSEELQSFLRSPEIDHSEATVKLTGEEGDVGRPLVVTFDNLAPARADATGKVIQEAEGDRIRAALGERFPATLRVIYRPSDPTATSTPEFETPTVEAIQGIFAEIGRSGVVVQELSDLSFSASITNIVDDRVDDEGNVIEGEVTKLRRVFRERFGPPLIFAVAGKISGYTVGGGIQEAKRLIGQTAKLEFKERTCGPLLPPSLDVPWPPDGLTDAEWLRERCSNVRYYTDATVALSGSNLVDAFAGTQPGIARTVVNIEFDGDGADEFFRITDRIARTRGLLAIFLDGEELIAPSAQQGIAGGRAFIQGPDFTPERTRTIAIQLRSGSLPVELELVQERNVDATLGADSLRKSVTAGAVGLGLVLAFMIFYYKSPGIVAAAALLMYAALLLAVFKLLPVTFTLSGVAALILSIGTAVDANILIAERTKEELRAGRSLFSAIGEGFSRAWPSIRDSNVSTLITCAVLFWFGSRLGTSIMQGFALTLASGTLVSMFTAYFASRVFMRTLASTPVGNRLTTWVPVGRVGGETAAEAGD